MSSFFINLITHILHCTSGLKVASSLFVSVLLAVSSSHFNSLRLVVASPRLVSFFIFSYRLKEYLKFIKPSVLVNAEKNIKYYKEVN
jgi:hypothetical protein